MLRRQREVVDAKRRRGDFIYSFDDALAAFPVADLADEGAPLYLWSTRQNFREGEAARVARAWGFEPVGEVIWGLRNAGMGAGPFRNDHEPVLVARRGSLPFPTGAEPAGVFFWKQVYNRGKVHSAKPLAFLDLVERLSPGPYVELFARQPRLGWDSWGWGYEGASA